MSLCYHCLQPNPWYGCESRWWLQYGLHSTCYDLWFRSMQKGLNRLLTYTDTTNHLPTTDNQQAWECLRLPHSDTTSYFYIADVYSACILFYISTHTSMICICASLVKCHSVSGKCKSSTLHYKGYDLVTLGVIHSSPSVRVYHPKRWRCTCFWRRMQRKESWSPSISGM